MSVQAHERSVFFLSNIRPLQTRKRLGKGNWALLHRGIYVSISGQIYLSAIEHAGMSYHLTKLASKKVLKKAKQKAKQKVK